jgi:hypothetical protein
VLSSRGHGARKEDIWQKEDAGSLILEHKNKPAREREEEDRSGEENHQKADQADCEKDARSESAQENLQEGDQADGQDVREKDSEKVGQEDCGEEGVRQKDLRQKDPEEDDPEEEDGEEEDGEEDCSKKDGQEAHGEDHRRVITHPSQREECGSTEDDTASGEGAQVRQEAAHRDPSATRE